MIVIAGIALLIVCMLVSDRDALMSDRLRPYRELSDASKRAGEALNRVVVTPGLGDSRHFAKMYEVAAQRAASEAIGYFGHCKLHGVPLVESYRIHDEVFTVCPECVKRDRIARGGPDIVSHDGSIIDFKYRGA